MLGMNCSFSDSKELVTYTALFPRYSPVTEAELPGQQLPPPVHLQGLLILTTAHSKEEICVSATVEHPHSGLYISSFGFNSLKWSKISFMNHVGQNRTQRDFEYS